MYPEHRFFDYFIRRERRSFDEPRVWLMRLCSDEHVSIQARFFGLMITADLRKRCLTARAWEKWKAEADAYWAAEDARREAMREAEAKAQGAA